MTDPRAIIVELLNNIGGRKEVEQYLRHYCGVESQKFAVIALDGDVLEQQLEPVASALSFLQAVGLYPIVVHGPGPAIQRALSQQGVKPELRDGVRVVPAEALETHRRELQRENLELVDALQERGCPARPIATGVIHAQPRDAERYGMVGEVADVDTTALSASIRAHQLPIVTSLGISPTGQALVVDPTDAAAALAQSIEPHKIILLTRGGGLLDETGHVIEAVNLSEDYERLLSRAQAKSRDSLERIRSLLERLPETTSVSVTSPEHLTRELFTHRGAGTLVRLGERVQRHDSFASVDQAQLRELVETCFERRLVDDYFETRDCHRVYVTERYRATAILTRDGDIPYLDKFAVTRKAQGEGLGGSVWARLRRDNPKLFWRSRSNNQVNGWYFQQAEGSYRQGRWTVFWYGLESFEQAQRCVEVALALPPTLEDGSELAGG